MINHERFLELCQLYGFEVSDDSQNPGIFVKAANGSLQEITNDLIIDIVESTYPTNAVHYCKPVPEFNNKLYSRWSGSCIHEELLIA